jgi:hypothetical protein
MELHHLQDFALHNQSPPLAFAHIEGIREAIRAVCVFARGSVTVGDTDLLRDAAESFKHFHMDRPSSTVAGARAIVSISNGFGEMRYGEQKWNGQEEVTVTTKDGNKYSLLWLIHNT